MDGLIFGMNSDGSYVKMTSTDLYFVDKYGNEECLSNFGATFKQNAPSYDELYNHWVKTKNSINGDEIMQNKFTTELVWHNCATYPPKEDFHPNLCVTDGRSVFNASYDEGEWYDPEFNEYIPQSMLRRFWWADVVQTIGSSEIFSKVEE